MIGLTLLLHILEFSAVTPLQLAYPAPRTQVTALISLHYYQYTILCDTYTLKCPSIQYVYILSLFLRKDYLWRKQSLVLINHTVICVAFGAAGGNKYQHLKLISSSFLDLCVIPTISATLQFPHCHAPHLYVPFTFTSCDQDTNFISASRIRA